MSDSLPEPEMAPNGWPRATLEGFRSGERGALAEVYRLHAGEVAVVLREGFVFESAGRKHRFAGYRSAFDLQDALHETFRLAFEPSARDRYDGLRPYGPYLRAIARNVVLRAFRAREVLFPEIPSSGEAPHARPGDRRGRSPAAAVAAYSGVAAAGPSPETEVAHAQVRALVERFVAGLSAEDQRLVQVRFVEGLGQRDAAERLGTTRQRLRTRELKVQKRLLRFLREHGELALVEGVAVGATLLGLHLAQRLMEGVLR